MVIFSKKDRIFEHARDILLLVFMFLVLWGILSSVFEGGGDEPEKKTEIRASGKVMIK